MTILQQLDSLALRTTGTELHGAIMELRTDYLAQFAETPAASNQEAIDIVLSVVSAQTRVPIDVILSARRTQSAAHARQLAMYLLRRLTLISTTQVARAMHRGDHTTALYGIAKISASCEQDARYKAKVDALLSLCGDRLSAHKAAA